LDAKAFGLVTGLLVLAGVALLWMRRRRLTEHNVSHAGITYVCRIPTRLRGAWLRQMRKRQRIRMTTMSTA
jgi:MYXO-CTERM domain-containing protein